MNSAREYCQAMAALLNGRSPGRIHHYDFLLEHGREFKAGRLPKRWLSQCGKWKECFRNSSLAALDNPKLRYVEGYATGVIPVPMHHAWCIDSNDDRVVDLTWKDQQKCAYFGVIFRAAWLRSFLLQHKVYGVLYIGERVNVPPVSALEREVCHAR